MKVPELIFLRYQHALIEASTMHALLVDFTDLTVLLNNESRELKNRLKAAFVGNVSVRWQQPVDDQVY